MTAGSDMAFISAGKIREGDTFLICTDGVANSLSDTQKKMYLKKNGDIAMEKIFTACNKRTPADNCTAIILKANRMENSKKHCH